MLGGLLIVILTTMLSFSMIKALKKKYPFIDVPLLHKLFYFHLALATVYLLYAKFNPSDSNGYYEKVLRNFRGESWMDYYGTSTIFIEFIGYPFVKFLGFSYEACMALFAFFGFVGFLYTYIFFKEHIKFKHHLFGVELNTLLFFLPNLHFWSSSFGKGSVIFMGIALFFFGISNIRSRWVAILFGGFIIYHVRPHIMLVMLVSSAIGFVFSTKGVSMSLRVLFVLGASIAFYFIYADVLSMVGIDEEEFVSQGLDLTHRATELAKATSGVDITNYSWPMKIFTFLYRPLFIDAPGMLGLIVSFENVFYLLFTFQLLTPAGIRFLVRGNFLVKTAFFSFFTVTIALAQVSGNLGLAIRQKSQVMMLFLYVVMAFLDENKMQQTIRQRFRRRRQITAEPETSGSVQKTFPAVLQRRPGI
jgi:hypothetical protein